MKITPITTSLYSLKHTRNFNNSPIKQEENEQTKKIMPNSQMVLAFCGGKSLNLAQTVQQIDKNGTFPPDVKEMCIEELKQNDKTKKTLIDIHKEKYADLYDCDSIEEIRFFFPEFKDVKSDKEVEYSENSFIDHVKKGEVPYFDKDKDVSLQLLQMYWAGGISLNELKKEFANQNVHHTFEKLNIPRLDKVYGHYLCLSDPVKNERLASIIKERNEHRTRTNENGTKREYSPRGPLSEEHKAKISESLKKYYQENPEMAFHLSEVQKKHLEENPQQKIVFSQVLLRAWDYPEAKSVKKALSKHMKRKDISTKEIVDLAIKTNDSELKKFWDKNTWAKSQFSKAMTKSWERQKFIGKFGLTYEPIATVPITSQAEQRELQKALGSEYEKIKDFQYTLIPDTRESDIPLTQEMIECQRITGQYYRNNIQASRLSADLKFCTILYSLNQIRKKLLPLDHNAGYDYDKLLSRATNLPKNASKLAEEYVILISYCLDSGHPDWAKTFINSIEKMDHIVRFDREKIPSITQEFRNIAREFSYNI